MAGKKKKHSPRYKGLAISFLLTMALLVSGVVLLDGLDGMVVVRRLLWPLTRLMGFILIGLVAGQIIEATGWTRYLAALASPLFRFAKLGDSCSAAFTTAFVSGVASNAMLYGFYQDGTITRRQLYLANFINQFPAYFLHLPTTFFIVVPLTGRAGLLYFALTFTALILRSLCLLVYGNFRIPEMPLTAGNTEDAREPVGKDIKSIFESIKKRLPSRLTTIAMYVLPIYVAVFLMNRAGIFEAVNRLVSEYIVTTVVPMESLSVVVLGFVAEFTSGFAAAGALMEQGVLTIKQTALALLIGNIVAFPIRALRHQLPRYVGIFSPKMGTQILLMGQALRVGSLVIVGIVFYFLFP